MKSQRARLSYLNPATPDFAKRCGCQFLSTRGGGYRLPVTVAAATSHVRTLATYV